jgi:Skp family chaperone for outer membrane proteins
MATVKKPIKKAQVGRLLKKGVEEIIPVAEKNLTNMTPKYNKKGLNMAIERRVNPEVAKKKMTKAQRLSFEVDDSYRKNGGSVKAKDGKWMQKAAASIKKRGTAGKCTPITKPGCTGRAKALAKTFKKIAKSNKKK